MRHPLAALATLVILASAAPAASAPARPAPKPAARPTPAPSPTVAPAIAEQLALLGRLERSQLRPAYAEAQLELAHRYQAAGQPKPALAAALAASAAFDRQVELHKTLSDQLTPYERARAERKAAYELGQRRDRANFQAAELARALGEDDTAIQHYVMVVQSQPESPLGQQALAALEAMGLVAPLPSASPSPQPKP